MAQPRPHRDRREEGPHRAKAERTERDHSDQLECDGREIHLEDEREDASGKRLHETENHQIRDGLSQ